MLLKLGFVGTIGQLVGFFMGIYVFFDWNEMEPYTWIIRKYTVLADPSTQLQFIS